MKILYADAWMIDALAAARLPTTTLLNISALLDTLSADDVAFYIDLNKNLSAFIPKAIVESFTPAALDLSGASLDKRLRRVHDALQARSVTNTSAVPKAAADDHLVLTCDVLDADTILFRHIPKPDESENNVARMGRLTERLIRQLYLSLSFERLIVLPVVKMYLDWRHVALRPNVIV
jgi:hypothetical protein